MLLIMLLSFILFFFNPKQTKTEFGLLLRKRNGLWSLNVHLKTATGGTGTASKIWDCS